MGKERMVVWRRALAALGTSVALHLGLGATVGVYLLGDVLAAMARYHRAGALVVTMADSAEASPMADPADVELPALPAVVATDEAMAAEAEAVAELAPPEPVIPPAPPTQVAATPDPVAAPDESRTPEVAAAPVEATEKHDAEPASPGHVTRTASIHASATGEPFVGRREVFEFLLDHFAFASHVMGAVGSKKPRMARLAEAQLAGDGWGAGSVKVSVVRAGTGTRVLHARGEFRPEMMPPIGAEAVVTLTYDAESTGDGRDRILASVQSRLEISGAADDPLVKLATAMVGSKAESESRRLLRTFAQVVRKIDEQPEIVYAALLDKPGVDRRELEQFRQLLRLP